MRLSIVVPAHNEEDNISQVVEEIERSLDLDYDLVIVNDHSTDRTKDCVLELCRSYPNIKVMDNTYEKGFANAVKFGLERVKTEAVVPVMADLCDDITTIKEMFKKIQSGFDVVCGSRYIQNGARAGGSRIKGFFSGFVGWSLHCLIGIPTHDIANAFKMYRKDVIEKIDINAKGFEVSMEIPLKAFFLGFKITEVPTCWKERTKGKSNFKMFRLFPNYFKFYTWAIYKKITG